MYFLYSSKVVAPITRISPLASIGFNRFPASIAPSVLPAPTIVWISSINRIISPFESSTSFKTAFKRSSNSPLNLAPAIRDPISNEKTFLFFKESGTSPFKILWANPSAIAVFPTPGSPIRTGLFLVLLEIICIVLLISPSLPIIGSIFPFLASSTRSLPYFSKTSYLTSGLGESTFLFPLISKIVLLNNEALIPKLFRKEVLSKRDKKICSTLM